MKKSHFKNISNKQSLTINKFILIVFLVGNLAIGVFPGHGSWVYISFASNIIFFLIIILKSDNFSFYSIPLKTIFILFLSYQIFVLIHGFFIAENYEQWRHLITSYFPFILLSFFTIICHQNDGFFYYIKFVLYYLFPFSFLFYLYLNFNENISYISFISPLYLLILFFDYIPKMFKYLCTLVVIFSCMTNFTNRTHLISLFVSILFYIFLRKNKSYILRKILITIFLLIPFCFIAIYFINGFNIFKYIEFLTFDEDKVINTFDSRSGVYGDALLSISNYKSFIFGNSPSDYYKSYLSSFEGVLSGKFRLGGSEVAFLNFIQFGGIIYLFIFFLIITLIIRRVFKFGKNIYVYNIALFISINWIFCFIEKYLELNFFWITFFAVLGFLQNKNFLEMSDIIFINKFSIVRQKNNNY